MTGFVVQGYIYKYIYIFTYTYICNYFSLFCANVPVVACVYSASVKSSLVWSFKFSIYMNPSARLETKAQRVISHDLTAWARVQ